MRHAPRRGARATARVIRMRLSSPRAVSTAQSRCGESKPRVTASGTIASTRSTNRCRNAGRPMCNIGKRSRRRGCLTAPVRRSRRGTPAWPFRANRCLASSRCGSIPVPVGFHPCGNHHRRPMIAQTDRGRPDPARADIRPQTPDSAFDATVGFSAPVARIRAKSA